MEDYIKPWLDDMSPSLRRLYDIGKKKKDSQKKLRLLDTIFERSLGIDYPTTLEQIYVSDLEKELQEQKQKIDDLHARWNDFIHPRRREMADNPSFKPQLPEEIQLALPDEIVDEIHSYVPIEKRVKTWNYVLRPSHEAELRTLRIKWWQDNNSTLCIPRCIDNCLTSRDCICEKWAGLVLTKDGGTAINRAVKRPASTKFARCSICGTLHRRELTCALDYLPASWTRCKKRGCY